MEIKEISYVYNGGKYRAKVQLLSPLTWIFLVTSATFDDFHVEYDEARKKWLAVEDDFNDKKLLFSIGTELTKIYGKDIQRTLGESKYSSVDFFVVDNGREDMICFWDSELRIRVAPLTDSPLFDDPKEVLYYGDHSGIPIAFQTIDYHGEDLEVILKAINWYAEYLDYPQMVVSKENPLLL